MPRLGRRQRILTAIAAVIVTLLAAAQFVALVRHMAGLPPATQRLGLASLPATIEGDARRHDRSVGAYAGYGTWVDVYDFVPGASHRSRGPALTPAVVDEMVERGVRTLYLQAARLGEESPGLLADRALLGQILVRAQAAGLKVVGWYLPRFDDVDRDLAHLQAIADYEVLGHRFDGVAVDIEWTDDVVDPAERSNKLVALSERLRAGVGDEPLGAIVLPPVQIEEINPDKWPGFPWDRLVGLYDVWLPMSYWTERTESSGYRDGRAYTAENVRRLREDLDDPGALVHPIGGIGGEVTADTADGFADAVLGSGAIGGSIYDWTTLDRDLQQGLADRLNQARRGVH